MDGDNTLHSATVATDDEAQTPAQPSPARTAVQALADHIERRIVGQHSLTQRLLIALLADGHLLVEGAPGLAKTRAIKVLAEGIEGDFHRVQFTPDLLPADLTGTEVYRPQDGSFSFQQGPLFHNLILADEVNRAPAKVQSALLEAMAERQITVGRTTYRLPGVFLVMATQNPIEQEGTYPLPEAQLDRFLLHVRIDYPPAEQELQILRLSRDEARLEGDDGAGRPGQRISLEAIRQARQEVLRVYMSDNLEHYLTHLVLATRDPGAYDRRLGDWVQWGASPRASIALDRCARARAWLAGRDYVLPEDVQALAPDVLRHRILLSYEAEADGIAPDRFVAEIIRRVPVP